MNPAPCCGLLQPLDENDVNMTKLESRTGHADSYGNMYSLLMWTDTKMMTK